MFSKERDLKRLDGAPLVSLLFITRDKHMRAAYPKYNFLGVHGMGTGGGKYVTLLFITRYKKYESTVSQMSLPWCT